MDQGDSEYLQHVYVEKKKEREREKISIFSLEKSTLYSYGYA